MDGSFELALVLANEAGHRVGAIRQLRWTDVDFQEKRILWREENDKIGMEHSPPLSEEAVCVLEQSRRKRGSIGDGCSRIRTIHRNRVRGTYSGTGGDERRSWPRIFVVFQALTGRPLLRDGDLLALLVRCIVGPYPQRTTRERRAIGPIGRSAALGFGGAARSW